MEGIDDHGSRLPRPIAMVKRWTFRRGDPAAAHHLAGELGLSSLLAQLLGVRNVTQREEAEAFLWPKLMGLHDPGLLPDMAKAVRRIRQAVESRQKITLYGDYDVDGTTGVAVLLKFFEQLRYPVEAYIPHRVEEGYGLNLDAVKDLHARGTQLVVTVDCGTTAREAVGYLQQAGVDVIVTDHHGVPEELPQAFALINPKIPGCNYPFPDLAGSGVAFKLAWAMAESFSRSKKVSPEFRRFLLNSLSYVALGTVADVVPLISENRILTRFGLTALRESPTTGLAALLDEAGMRDRRVASSDVAFRIAPRLNAAGRMGHASRTLELLTTADPDRAREIAQAIEKQNSERKKKVEIMTREAMEAIREEGLERQPVIVLARENWHAGVLGIVAQKLLETYGRPAVVIALDNGQGKGSARSIPGYDITDALGSCRDLLTNSGGHARAGGLQIQREQFSAFRERLVAHAASRLGEQDFLPKIEIDAEVLLTQLSPEAVSQLELLEPFGEKNPEPLLAAADLTIVGQPRVLGERQDHLSFFVRQGETSLRAMAFSQAVQLRDTVRSGVRCSLAFTPRLNTYRGETTVDLIVRDVRQS
ncbi:MAG: single-stranded-DNA-specific exonuclease RecJ [Planctomycetes bacterium]|nr:single-stranded-DNA-specific exonuclease RecJ [Planctomycetota bacterium]